MSHKLEIENITIEYDNRVVISNFSMVAETSATVAIMGASGCGKSSLLKAIIGFVPLKNGVIRIDGEELSEHNVYKVRNHISYIPQDITFPCEWVHELVELTLNLRANKAQSNKELLIKYIDSLVLETGILDKRLSEISGGQRQRVMIAIAALLNKDIILLDEPTSALDSESSRLVFNFLSSLKKRPTIIAVTHDNEFATLCQQTIKL